MRRRLWQFLLPIHHDVSSDRAWWLPYREPCVSCQSPASAGLGSPGDSRSHSGHVGNTRRRRLITCCLLWLAARRFWLGLHLMRDDILHITTQTSRNPPVFSPRPVKTVEVRWKPLLWRSYCLVKKNLCREPLCREFNVEKIRFCKTVGGPVKPEFSTCLPVLWSSKGPKVFATCGNIVFHWLGAYTKWSLVSVQFPCQSHCSHGIRIPVSFCRYLMFSAVSSDSVLWCP